MIKIEIKPLSVNEAWKGRRFKTDTYKRYENAVLFLLPKLVIPEPPFKLSIEFSFSSKGSDLDNPLKPLLDILQKKYKINDKDIYELNVKKIISEKGNEFFRFEIVSLKK